MMKIISSIRDIGLSIDGRSVTVHESEGIPRYYDCDYVGMGIVTSPQLAEAFCEFAQPHFIKLAPTLRVREHSDQGQIVTLFTATCADQHIFAGPFNDSVLSWFAEQGFPFGSCTWEMMCLAHVWLDYPEVFRSIMLSEYDIVTPDELFIES